MAEVERTASCSCGALQITLRGEPRRTYLCSCLDCQRCTGSAFAYRAIFSDDAVAARRGTPKTWRRTSASNRWLEQAFCSDCGSVLYMTAQALPGALSISVGCFADPDFAPPIAAHWPDRRHAWLKLGGVPDVG